MKNQLKCMQIENLFFCQRLKPTVIFFFYCLSRYIDDENNRGFPTLFLCYSILLNCINSFLFNICTLFVAYRRKKNQLSN